MTDADIIRESWRWHFFDLLRAGAKLPEGSTITEFQGDDADFDQFAKDLEEGVAELSMIDNANNNEWDEVSG